MVCTAAPRQWLDRAQSPLRASTRPTSRRRLSCRALMARPPPPPPPRPHSSQRAARAFESVSGRGTTSACSARSSDVFMPPTSMSSNSTSMPSTTRRLTRSMPSWLRTCGGSSGGSSSGAAAAAAAAAVALSSHRALRLLSYTPSHLHSCLSSQIFSSCTLPYKVRRHLARQEEGFRRREARGDAARAH